MNYLSLFVRPLIVLFWIVMIGVFFLSHQVFRFFEPERSITLFSWTELVDASAIAQFEQKTGIRVYMSYYEGNEELLAKLQLVSAGYDLVVPSDYLVPVLIARGLVQQIDWSKILFKERLQPRLLHAYYDPENRYSIPYLWSVYGVGMKKNTPELTGAPSWGWMFDTAHTLPRAMLDDARESVLIASTYVYGSIQHMRAADLRAVQELLVQQKPYVVSYTDVAAPFLLASGEVRLALAPSSYIIRLLRTRSDIDFVVPGPRPIATVDTLVIPVTCTKLDLVYEFINFLYEQEVLQMHVEKTCFFAPTIDVPCVEVPFSARDFVLGATELEYLNAPVSLQDIYALWVRVKSCNFSMS